MTEGLRWKTRVQIDADLDRVIEAVRAEDPGKWSPEYRAGFDDGYGVGYDAGVAGLPRDEEAE